MRQPASIEAAGIAIAAVGFTPDTSRPASMMFL